MPAAPGTPAGGMSGRFRVVPAGGEDAFDLGDAQRAHARARPVPAGRCVRWWCPGVLARIPGLARASRWRRP